MREEHQAEAAKHPRERRLWVVKPLGVHNPHRCTHASPPGLLVASPHHSLSETNAPGCTRRTDLFSSREQDGSAAAGHVEHTLAGLDANLLHQTPTKVGKAAWPRSIVLRS